MKVTVVAHGGLMAGLRRAPLVVDASQLPVQTAAELAALVESAEAAVQNSAPASTFGAPDAMTYTLTVDHGDRINVFKSSDIDTRPQVTALRDWLSLRA